jgi:DHA1 family bicyclomycin/chloramphenicol resistance-like MFS transporter
MTSPTAKPFAMGEREFVVMMALLQALQALAIDAMLPALGVMSHDLGVTDPNRRQLVIGIFLISSGLGSLFPGALADRFGRRPVLFVCVGGYVVCSLASALAPSFDALLVLRACAGFVSAGMIVLSGAIIRDRFSGDKMARTQSLVTFVFMVVPMIAPSIGQAVLLIASWRWVFGIMAVLGAAAFGWAWLRLPETQHPEFRQAINLRAIGGNMRTALTTRSAVGYVFGAALIQASMFGYLNSSQQLVAEHFGAGANFPLVFGGMAVCMALGSLVNSTIVERFGARRVSHAAMFGYIVLGGLQFALASQDNETIWQFIPVMTLNMCLMAFITANFTSIALQPFARIAGAAASVQVFLRMVIGASVGALIGQAYDGSARPLAFALLVAGCGCLALVLYSEKGRLFRRLHGQVEQA